MKTKEIILEIVKELLWWVIALIIAAGVMYPLYSVLAYKCLPINTLLIVVAVSYFRYAITIKSVFILRSRWVRFLLCVVNINFFVYVLRRQQAFMTIYDSYQLSDLGVPLHNLAPEREYGLFRYFYTETTFFVMACLLLSAALTARIIGSYWSTARLRLNAGDEE